MAKNDKDNYSGPDLENSEYTPAEVIFLPSAVPSQTIAVKGTGGEEPIVVIPPLKSIRFRLWIAFIIMTVFMLAILWVYELVYYSVIHISIEESAIFGMGNEITEFMVKDPDLNNNLDSQPFRKYIENMAKANRINIIVLDDADNVVYYALVGSGAVPKGLTPTIKALYEEKVEEFDAGYVFNTTRDTSIEYIVAYGQKKVLGTRTLKLFVSSEVSPLVATRNNIMSQLLIICGVLLIIGVVVAYVGSGFAAKPMRELTIRVGEKSRGKIDEMLPTNTPLAEINELSAAFNDALAKAESNNRFRRDLLANVSHDMKTPLTMIRAYAEMIRDITGGNMEKSAKNASIIISETDRMSSLISEVIELAQLESGAFELHPAIFNLSDLIQETIGHFSIIEDAKGYLIESEISQDVFVMADSERIARVLYNLIGNAMNYTGEDKKIFIRCRKMDDGKVIVSVIDTGKGMTQQELYDVWGKYYRLVQDKRKVLGSGLGLSIVKSILELHNVRYGVRSIKGKGSNFWFELPCVDEKDLPGDDEA